MMKQLQPNDWGLETAQNGELVVAGCKAIDLSSAYGTPLHVINEERLGLTARRFLESARAAYRGSVSVHYPFKCNSLPAVLDTVKRAGMAAEVMTPFELHLATRLGYSGSDIIVNGPCKTEGFLRECLDLSVRFVIVDSLEELAILQRLAAAAGCSVDILLRVNPDYIPRGMNRGSATGSRTGCAFGLDWKGGEIEVALDMLIRSRAARFRGFHFHIGTGISRPRDYAAALGCLPNIVGQARARGLSVRVLDVGGGIASPTSREFTSFEMLKYQALGILPELRRPRRAAALDDFTGAISRMVEQVFFDDELPELIYEPGRCIASQNQFLLLTVHRVKRRGNATWLITDGGLGTVTLPTFYESHEVFLCNDIRRDRKSNATIIGPACFAGDVVYRNKKMPEVNPGEVLAVMDSGAYFNALESSFGFPRPAVVAVRRGTHSLVRRRETYEEMTERDILISETKEEVLL